MGTIIAHGKNQWGRSNKNRRVDSELEAELNSVESPQSVVTDEAVMLKDISEQVNIGTKVIKKMDDIPLQAAAEVSVFRKDRSIVTPISHEPKVLEKKYKAEDVVSDVVIKQPVEEEIPQPKKTRKKKN